MGGAFASLGGDFYSVGYNPAGLAIYRTNEITFTPFFDYHKIQSEYMGTPSEDTRYSLGVNNIGIVASFNRDNESGWVGTNVGIGYNRHNNFSRNRFIQGVNYDSSMSDYFTYHANGLEPDDLFDYEWMAYETFIIDLLPGEDRFYEPLVPLGVTQREVKTTSGYTGEWTFSFAANYQHKLLLGASLGIESVSYESRTRYYEIDDQNYGDFQEFKFNQALNTEGTGVTFKAGAVYRPVDILRIGGAVHLPTFYNLEDRWSDQIESWFDDPAGDIPSYNRAEIETNIKEYGLNTPFRLIGGISVMLFDKTSILSLDYEHVDYTTMKLRETDGGYLFLDENQTISDVFRAAGNLRAGAEVRLGPSFMLRGGYAYHASPYATGQVNQDASYNSFSAGFGFREGNFMLDVAYVFTDHKKQYFLYQLPGDIGLPPMEPAVNSNENNRFMVTLGYKF